MIWATPEDMIWFGYPRARNPETLRAKVAGFQKPGVRVIPYSTPFVLSIGSPESRLYGHEWLRVGEGDSAALVVRGQTPEQATSHVVVWGLAGGEKVIDVDLTESSTQRIGFPLPDGWSTPQLVGFSPHGDELVVADREAGVTFYDADSGESRRNLAPEGTTLNNVGAWSLSPDGRQLAVFGLQDRENEVAAALYDATTGQRRVRLPTHTKYPPIAVQWNHDRSRIALKSGRHEQSDKVNTAPSRVGG